jgi:type IV pilus assembly protein PilQ
MVLLISDSSVKITFDFEDAEVRTVIEYIAEKSAMNIVCGEAVKGRVTLRVQDMAWFEALETVMKSAGLAYERYDNCLYLDSPENIREKRTGTRVLRIYRVRNTNLSSIADEVNGILSATGTVLSDARTAQIVVYDYQDIQEKVGAFIKEMDKPARQVMISVRIVDIIKKNEDAVEFDWDFTELSLPLHEITETDFQTGNSEGIAGYLNVAVDVKPIFDFGVLIKALSEKSEDITVRSGQLMVQEGYEASILAGSRFGVPVRDMSGNTVVQMFSSGFEISATPYITSSRHIKMKIKITLSDLDRAAALIGRPIMSMLETELGLHLADGETVIIATHTGDEGSGEKRRLGQPEIPLLEYLLSPWSRSENVVFQCVIVTPRIVE